MQIKMRFSKIRSRCNLKMIHEISANFDFKCNTKLKIQNTKSSTISECTCSKRILWLLFKVLHQLRTNNDRIIH